MKNKEKTLVARINRQLVKRYEQLHKTREGTRANFELGDYYVRDMYTNAIAYKNVDPFELAQELGLR